MIEVIEPPVLWFAGFTDLDSSGHWVRRVLARLAPPRHVVAFRDTAAGLLVVQQTLSRLMVTVQAGHTAASFTAEIEASGGLVLPLPVPPEDGAAWMPRPFSCVCVVRALASLPWRPQTPRGLARELTGRA